MTAVVEELGRAKVNLYLHVTGRRPDGYHLLDSLMVFAETGDHLTFAPADHLSLTMDGPGAAALAADDQENIILKAARLLADHLKRPATAAIHLHKILPVAAGIGGGSADAAATLRGLCRLWNARPSDEDLQRLALQLGADVPVCLFGRPMLVSGIGEILNPAPTLPVTGLVLVNPRQPLSTPSVFRQRQGEFQSANPLHTAAADARELASQLAQRQNGLTAAAITLAPVIQDMLDALAHTPHCLLSRMSGSGATCFGLYGSADDANAAAQSLQQSHPDWWVAASSL